MAMAISPPLPSLPLQYPYPSNLNSASFVSIKLSSYRNNYSVWATQMLCLLESQELVGFIDGTISAPNDGTTKVDEVEAATKVGADDDYRRWKISDRLVKGWILGSLHEDVLVKLVDLSTARSVWMKLLSTLGSNSQGSSEDEDEFEDEDEDEEEEEEEEEEELGKPLFIYPYPSTIYLSDYVSIKLTKNNYFLWARQILSLLKCQKLMSFVMDEAPLKYYKQQISNSGTEKNKRKQPISKQYEIWEKTDLLVQKWILDSISRDVISTVTGMTTSRNIMIKLEKEFVPNSHEYFISRRHIVKLEASKLESLTNYYSPLYKAGLEGDWEVAKRFMDKDSSACTAAIAPNGDTIIHIAVLTGKAFHFLESLVGYLAIQDLSVKNRNGETPLVSAAVVGNFEAAKILMRKRPDLLQIWNHELMLPLHVAAKIGHRYSLLCFQTASRDEDYVGEVGARHLYMTITHGFIDIALDLITRYPHIGRSEASLKHLVSLSEIAARESFFRSGNHLTFLQNLIYTCSPLKFENKSNGPNCGRTDVENQASNCQVLMNGSAYFLGVFKRWYTMIWDAMELLVPHVKKLRQKKLFHYQVIQLVKRLCEAIRSTNDEGAYARYLAGPVIVAASLGIFEIIEEIVDIFPASVWSKNLKGQNIFQIAVINRCEKVFNLVYQMSGFRNFIGFETDQFKNNILHLAGQLAPPHKLNLVSGAALQMQRELQWFQEVAKFFGIADKGMKNSKGETPAMIFTREHKELVIAGEEWMKDTATSCTIAAVLIIIIAFAAAIAVPGGNSRDTGLPIFSYGKAFWLFAISDAISLFTSTTSSFIFVSIHTARYAEEDFLHALPKRLILGLLTLFLSVISMIIAFGATIYLVFGQKTGWTIPIAGLACLPITSFVTLQFPLLIDVYSSTYGRGIFGKQSDRSFH